ncbi:ATP-binding cassette domain-containing protein, partial [Marinitoga sp. 1138]
MIEVKGIKKSFKEKEVLKGVDFDVKEGEKFVILGENGAGKSTLFYILTKVYNPDEGEIKIKEGKYLLGFVEEPQFIKTMNAYENMKYISSSIYKKVTKEEMDKYLKITGIQQHAKKKVGKYSTGMKKRLAVSLLLMIDPDIYIFDEPT